MFVIKMFLWLIFLNPTFSLIFFSYPTEDTLIFLVTHHFLFSPKLCHK